MSGSLLTQRSGYACPSEILVEDRGSDRTLVVFGGIKGGLGIAPFEFRTVLASSTANTVFFRDHSQMWYQQYLGGGGLDVDRLFARHPKLEKVLRRPSVSCVGNSMGGYGAIMFGLGLGARYAIAFAPQTLIGPLARRRVNDRRWHRQMLKMYLRRGPLRRTYDLRSFSETATGPTRIRIFVGTDDPLDVLHAEHLALGRNVELNRIEGASHDAVKKLRDSGKLIQILQDE